MDNTIFQNYINSLRFFTGNGKEILMRKQDSVSWEIIPNDLVYPAFLKNPKGHLEASLEDDMTSEFIEQQSGDYMTSDIEGDTQTLYTYTFNNSKDKEVMYIKRGQRIIKKVIATTDDTVEVKFVLNRFTGEIDIIENDDIIVKNTHSIITNGNTFVCLAYRDTEYSLKRKSLKASIVVDEPGIIQPAAKFYRKSCDADFVRSYELLESSDNVCNNNPKQGWKEIAEDSLTYSIDNVYDIIFFGYKSVSNGEETIMSNTLRLTVNDGENVVTEDYYLEDFFVGTNETCLKDNLVVNHIYNQDLSDDFFVESADEILHHQLSTKSEVYGVTDRLIVLCLMAFYEQWDKELLNALADFIEEVHNNQKRFSEKEILTTVLSILKKYNIEAEYWDSSSVVAIVRDLDEYGQSSEWETIERKTEIAKELLELLVYATDADLLKLETVPYYVLTYNIPESQYPYVRYVGDVIQEIVSSSFIEPQTIVVVCEDENGNYLYPQITDGNTEYRIHFRFEEKSEMFFIQMKDSVEMIRQNSLFALLPSEINITDNPRETNALHFTTGFQAEREGCYQNIMGIFLRNMQTDEDFFVGAIMFKTQVEAEDERYRTLLENFGVPDPKTYPNIFREQDPDEQGIDWKLINKKSKELMLSYDDIFPYSGTYRALFRAIKFLGYDDIVFKEWYKIIDNTDTLRYVAIQNFDVSTGKSIRNVLKSYGVEYSQYQRYSKLNRLSMIYHLQEISSGEFEDRLEMYAYKFCISQNLNVFLPSADDYLNVLDFAEKPNLFNKNTWKDVKVKILKKPSFNYICNQNGEYLSKTSTAMMPVWTTNTTSALLASYTTFKLNVPFTIEDGRYSWMLPDDEIPLIKNIYEFRNDEILAKLYQVKLWIERYITGVGCYISDINGESIILERIKTQAWMTDTTVNDMTTVGRFTPRAAVKTHPVLQEDGTVRNIDDVFTDSSINIRCTLNEFRSSTIDDYSDFPIERFIRWQYDNNGNPGPMTLDVSVDGLTVREDFYPSPTLDSLTVADEYEYTLKLNDASSGSLYEFADASCLDNPIMVSDGEITLFDENKHTSTITNSKSDDSASNECPIIEITKGNIREVYGDWSPDSEDNNIAFSILSYLDDDGNYYVKMTSKSDEQKFLFKGGVLLTPEKNNAIFEYTDQNKWSLPMIVVKGYYPSNQMYSDYMDDNSRRVALPENGYFPREKTFVIEILEGSIHFRNHHQPVEKKECRSADIIFSEAATLGMGEQDIRINYSYSSDRLPIASFPTQEQVKEVVRTQKFDDFQQLYDFMDSLIVKNTEVDIPVNRIGTYTVSVKAYDAYNNTFASTSDDFIEVKAAAPSIDIIVNLGQSDNSIEFYKENLTSDSSLVAKLTDEEKEEVNSKMDATPLFPKTYKIYSASHDTEEDEIVFDNISYAIDTPKKDERIILTNMTEQVYDVKTENDKLKFEMKNGNPLKQNIYNLGGTVSICAWSEKMKSVLSVVKDVEVIGCEKPNHYRTDLTYPDGYILVDKDTIMTSDISEYILNPSDDVTIYIIDTTEVDITDKCENIILGELENTSTGVVTRLSFIPVDRDDADNFKPDTMVKIRIEYSDSLVAGGSKMLVNESAYRILEITEEIREALDISYDDYGYVINGHIDICDIKKFHSRDIFDKTIDNTNTTRKRYVSPMMKTTMRPLHDEPVEYELIVTEDAVESMYVYQNYKFYGLKTTVKYDDSQLMFGAYMDDQYAALPMKYDPLDLFEIWSPKAMEQDVDYYRYRDFPITVDAGRYIIMKGLKTVPQLKDGWKTMWKWQTYAIRDLENLREKNQDDLRRMLLFESNSKILTVRPQMLGSQSAELYLTDLYGNVISNIGGGNLYVRDTVEEDVENVLKRNNAF